MKALLIIDMQKVSFTSVTPRFESDKVVERINALADKFRKEDEKVIFIQHDGTKQGFCMPDTEEWEILSSLNVKPEDLVIAKTANDAFYNSMLKNELDIHDVEEVVITGCATDFCVDATVKSALANDFDITIIKDGHTTANRKGLKAKLIIDYFNWLWSEMIPTQGKISLVKFADYMSE